MMKAANCFFINLFRNFGPRAFDPWKPWVEEWVTHRESRYQRVAIALWGAALVCHNHWPASEAFAIQHWAVKGKLLYDVILLYSCSLGLGSSSHISYYQTVLGESHSRCRFIP